MIGSCLIKLKIHDTVQFKTSTNYKSLCSLTLMVCMIKKYWVIFLFVFLTSATKCLKLFHMKVMSQSLCPKCANIINHISKTIQISYTVTEVILYVHYAL